MSLLFWRKTQETGIYRKDGIAHSTDVAATETNPLPVRLLTPEDDDPPRFQLDMAYQPPIAGQTVTRLVQVPGIGTGAAYESGDAFGTLITFHNVFRPEKCSGTIVSAFFLDMDDEGLQKDVPIYIRSITATADTSAAAPSDADLLYCRGAFSISTFVNLDSNQVGTATNIGLWVNAEGSTNLYTQLITRGADNIAAANIPWVGLVIVPD